MISLGPPSTKRLLPLLALPYVLFLCLPGYHFTRWDTLIYTLPLQKDVMSQWMSGTLPAWSSGMACGTPLLANLNAGVLYPFKLLLTVLPLQEGFKLYLLAHVLLAFMGLTTCFKKLGLRQEAAIAGAACYAFGGYARSLWDTHNITSWAWIPWAWLGLIYLCTKDDKRSGTLLTTGAFCMMILGGEIQGFAGWVGAACLYLLLHRADKISWGYFCLCLGISLLICSPQLIPSWIQLKASYRAGALPLNEAMERSFHPIRLLDLVVPYAFGTHEIWHAKTLFGAEAQRLSPWTASMAVTPLLFLLPVTSRLKQRTGLWILILGAGGFFLSLGTFLGPAVVVHRLPLIDGFRYPEKYLLWCSLALAYLVANGFHVLYASGNKPSWNPKQCRIGLILLLGGALCFLVAPADWVGPQADKSRVLMFWALAVIPCLLCLRPSKPVTPAYLLVCCLWSLGVQWYQEQPLNRIPDPQATPSELVQAIQSAPPLQSGERFFSDVTAPSFPTPGWAGRLSPTQARKISGFYALSYNTPGLWDIPAASGFSPFETDGIHHYRDTFGGAVFNLNPDDTTLAHFLRQTRVGLLYTSGQRWHRLQSQENLTGTTLTAWALPNGATTLLVKLQTSPAVTFSGDEAAPILESIRRLEEAQMDMRLTPGGSATMHLSEAWAPGWSASDNQGNPLNVNASPHGFMDISLPPDVRYVKLTYRPPGIQFGWLACLTGFCVLVLLQFYVTSTTRKPTT